MQRIHKVLIANRGEIAIRIIRACKELDIQTVAIYSKEDIGTLHRLKADESYLIGEDLDPTQAYLDIEGILSLAKAKGVDAIHPGYGFLSENQTFAQRCQEEGILFIGPEVRHLRMFGDKTSARQTAQAAGIPVIPGSNGLVESVDQIQAFAQEHGFPIMLKAVSGGGGKGMRVVQTLDEIQDAYDRVKSEALKSFGNSDLYVEKYIANPKHIEVQVLADQHGNCVHLFERDCSIQRRHQKVVEVAPSFSLDDQVRQALTQASLQLMNHISYVNAGTVEFLVTDQAYYFIEVNPRVQVEHTITELVTGIDIVKSQILIADGADLHGPVLQIPSQDQIQAKGYAIQCRITTEDPLNHFAPDSGKITAYQSPGGFGVRLDAGDAFAGAIISPYYDSLLVKISTYSNTLQETIDKMRRALKEIRVRGLKTNIRFLQNIMADKDFIQGHYTTRFIDDKPDLFQITSPRDRGAKLLNYIGNVTVNGFPGIGPGVKPDFPKPVHLTLDHQVNRPLTLKHVLDQAGPDEVAQVVKQKEEVLLTDTSLRDAHQSLLSTRMRTKDLLGAAAYMNQTLSDYFSFEMWGGATFDVAYNFLREDPWDRLRQLRQTMPDVMLQMLLRASNAVGYTNYPDNVVDRFIKLAAHEGIDVFRIFDSLNWLESLKVSIEAALETGKFVEGTICYTGDLLDPNRSKVYDLDYYVNLAKDIEGLGVHSLAIKDMAGILKPEAGYQLIKALKETVKIPIHLHSHDTSGNGLALYSRAIDAGVDILDVANPALSGLTSQPNAASLAAIRQGRDQKVSSPRPGEEALTRYWQVTRSYYQAFESQLRAPWPGVYAYEMPGGQYTNFQFQAQALGLGDRFDQVLDAYQAANRLLGDITKVTPSSKVVGDLALFMVQNDLNEDNLLTKGKDLNFPASVVAFMQGDIGQPPAGMNKDLQAIVLKGQAAYTDRPGQRLPAYDFEGQEAMLASLTDQPIDESLAIAYALYPKVVSQYLDFQAENGQVWKLDTPTFFYGLKLNERLVYELDEGKTLVIELMAIGPTKANGYKTVHFELNGLSYPCEILDQSFTGTVKTSIKADRTNPHHIPAPMPGTISHVLVEEGDQVKANQVLMITEAMKMENSIKAPAAGQIQKIHGQVGDQVAAGDLLMEIGDPDK